jgi:Flp pilus assembly pilin Flp
MKDFLMRLIRDETGAESVELGVSLSIVAVGTVTSFRGLQDKMGEGLSTITDAIEGATAPEGDG